MPGSATLLYYRGGYSLNNTYMATVINTTPATREESGVGWGALALVVLAALLIIGLFVWPGYLRNSAAPAGGTNIDVTVPNNTAPVAPSVDGGGTMTP